MNTFFSKTLFLFFFLFFFHFQPQKVNCQPNLQIPTDRDCTQEDLFEKYWQLRKKLEDRFMLVDRDLLNDCVNNGIGIWDEDNCHYDKAGFGLPALGIILTEKEIYPDPNSCCNGSAGSAWHYQHSNEGECLTVNANEPTAWNTPNVFSYLGSDVPWTMGYYMAQLATEYELSNKHGREEQKQKALEDLFLQLQTYRRLDATANRLLQKAFEDNGECTDWVPDLSGYSGFFLRDDAPASLQGLLNDPNAPAEHQIGAVQSFFACMESPTDILDSGHAVVSQDQIIGLLYGLSFVAQFIPEDAEVTTCSGAVNNIRDMAANIAEGMINNISSDGDTQIEFPCSDENVPAGPNAVAYYAGMFDALRNITAPAPPNASIPSGALEDAWESYINWSTIGPGLWFPTHKKNNTRMTMELVSVTNHTMNMNVQSSLGSNNANNNELFYMTEMLFNKLNGWAGKTSKKKLQRKMKILLCSLGCEGKCINNGDLPLDYGCETNDKWGNDYSLWRTGFTHSGDWDINRETNNIDFMLAFNIYTLLYECDAEYYNPNNMMDSPETGILSSNTGGTPYFDLPNSDVCSGDEITIDLNTSSCGISDFTTSPGVTIVDIENDFITVTIDQTFSGEGWVRIATNGGDCGECDEFGEQVFNIGSPPVPSLLINITSCQYGTVNFSTNDNCTWEFQGGNVTYSNSNYIEVTASTLPTYIYYSCTVSNDCGETKIQDRILVEPCAVTGGPYERNAGVFPNPANLFTTVYLGDLFLTREEISTNNGRLVNRPLIDVSSYVGLPILIYDSNNNLKIKHIATSTQENINISSLSNGLYRIVIRVENKLYTRTLIVEK